MKNRILRIVVIGIIIIGREINPKVYQRAEWQKLVNNKNAFIQEIVDKPKLFIIGAVNDL